MSQHQQHGQSGKAQNQHQHHSTVGAGQQQQGGKPQEDPKPGGKDTSSRS